MQNISQRPAYKVATGPLRFAANEGDFKTTSTDQVTTSVIEGRELCRKSAHLLVKSDILASNIGQGPGE
jgi:hypothetical protein